MRFVWTAEGITEHHCVRSTIDLSFCEQLRSKLIQGRKTRKVKKERESCLSNLPQTISVKDPRANEESKRLKAHDPQTLYFSLSQTNQFDFPAPLLTTTYTILRGFPQTCVYFQFMPSSLELCSSVCRVISSSFVESQARGTSISTAYVCTGFSKDCRLQKEITKSRNHETKK